MINLDADFKELFPKLEFSLKDYQIASKFIRSVLCDLIDERGAVADIERWYRLFHLHCME